MGISVNSISELDQDTIATREDIIKAFIQEYSSKLDVSPGTVIQQVLTQPNAILDTVVQTEIDRLRRSQSIDAVIADPELADDALVDSIAANFGITRKQATTVTGVAIVVVSTPSTTIISENAILSSADGRTFSPTAVFVGVIDAARVTTGSERFMQRRSDGNYWFAIDVEENTAGGAYLAQGSALTFTTPAPGNVVEIYAASDFRAAIKAETNTELVARMQQGISAKTIADRSSITAILQDNFEQLVDASIIGHGDAEMTRSAHNIFGISHGGAADIYVRTSPEYLIEKVTVSARPVAVDGGTIIYEATLRPENVKAGFYSVDTVAVINPAENANNASLKLTFEEVPPRSVRTIDEPVSPYFGDEFEAEYSKYQGAVVLRIVDPNSQSIYTETVAANITNSQNTLFGVTANPTILIDGVEVALDGVLDSLTQTTRYYDVYLRYMPDIDSIQDFVMLRERRQPGAEPYLVKAAIPCFVGVTLSIRYDTATVTPDIPTLQQAVSDAINAVKFSTMSLTSSVITAAVTSVLGSAVEVVSPVNMTGNLRTPGGNTVLLTGTTALDIPNNYDYGVSRRTVAYIAVPANIAITLIPVGGSNA